MTWALHHTDPFKLKRGAVAPQVRAALTVSQGAPPAQGSEQLTDIVDVAAKLVPHVAKVGHLVYVTATGHDGEMNAVTVSVSGQPPTAT